MKNFYDTHRIMIHLFQISRYNYLPVEVLYDFLSYLHDSLKLRSKLDDYDIFYNIDRGSLERTIDYNRDRLRLDNDEDRIYLRQDVSADKLAELYPIDEVISSIVYEYCLKYFRADGGYSDERDSLPSRDTRGHDIVDSIRRFFGTRR